MPFGKEVVDELFDDSIPEEKAAKEALRGNADFRDRLALHSRLFALQYVALEEYFPEIWGVKPKLHQFLELCIDGGLPSANWNYRDEDVGGACAGMARRRVGSLGPTATSANLLTRSILRSPAPRLVRGISRRWLFPCFIFISLYRHIYIYIYPRLRTRRPSS